jgi:hypothetical protein
VELPEVELLVHMHLTTYTLFSEFQIKKIRNSSSGNYVPLCFPPINHLLIVVNANFKIIPQCQIDNEYINGYFLVMIATFKCNHDIRCFIGGDGLDVTYYIMKYTTKI